MSMLAERRKKQKWSLNPRGKEWSEDKNKFGQKLLEKMGWSVGKGLGAKEDGIKVHISVRYKNDSKGMGFKETDDQWTEHESQFSQLLNSLTTDKKEQEDESLNIQSLEEKSQKSKARVHYHKFTRGKDLSRYSEKDLANIFGKKSLKKEKNIIPEESKQLDNSENKKFGVETYNGGNMFDYFKQKLPTLKKTKVLNGSESESEQTFGFGFKTDSSNVSNFVSYLNENDEPTKEKKKKKRKAEEVLDVEFTPLKKKFKNFDNLNTLNDEDKIEQTPVKKAKKHKDKMGEINPAFNPVYNEIIVEKKPLESIQEEDCEVPEKTRKKKNNTAVDDGSTPLPSVERKKKKKTKQCDGLENIETEVSEKIKTHCIENPAFNSPIGDETNPLPLMEVERKLKKKIKRCESLENISTEEKISKKNKSGFENLAFSTPIENERNHLPLMEVERKQKKKSKGCDNLVFENLAFDDKMLENVEIEVSVIKVGEKKKKKHVDPETSSMLQVDETQGAEKKKKKKKQLEVGEEKGIEFERKAKKSKHSEATGETTSTIDDAPISERKKKNKRKLAAAENPCFNPNDESTDVRENTSSSYEVKRKKKTPKLDDPVINDDLLTNIVVVPDTTEVRKKNVRFSRNNSTILIDKSDSPADLRKRKRAGLENKAYDEFGNRIEESVSKLSRRMENYQAQVENDINESKVEMMVGEVGNPDGDNEILPDGTVKLKFKNVKFGRMPAWMRKKDTTAKSSYRHLIKGDIVLDFKGTNMHEIDGYLLPKCVK